MQWLLEAIGTQDFVRSIILLLFTAALTGVLVPQIAARLSEHRDRKQKLFEADIARQRDVLAAQAELLRNLSKIAWRFQLLNINVSFCKLSAEVRTYEKAVDKYQADSAELLGQLRAELSTSRRLASVKMQQGLRDLYFNVLLPVDTNLERLIKAGPRATRDEWQVQHDQSFGDAQQHIEDALAKLALEFRLTSSLANDT